MKTATYLGHGIWDAWVGDVIMPVAWDVDKQGDQTIMVWRQSEKDARRLLRAGNFEIAIGWQPPRDRRGIINSDSEFIYGKCDVSVIDDTLVMSEDREGVCGIHCRILKYERVRGVRKHKEW